jgi:hypothetical protein
MAPSVYFRSKINHFFSPPEVPCPRQNGWLYTTKTGLLKCERSGTSGLILKNYHLQLEN